MASLPRSSPSRNGNVVFLDRDGVINRQRPDHVKSWDEFEFLPGALAALAELTRADIPLVVVTNQSAVGRGLLTPHELALIHARMTAEIRAHGGSIAAIYVCMHAPEAGCTCRKPGTDLFQRACLELGFSLTGSVMIGDSPSDEEAARSVGCQPILLGSAQSSNGALRAPDLAAAAGLASKLLGKGAINSC